MTIYLFQQQKEKIMTTEKLLELLKIEIERTGNSFYSEKRKTIEEMLRMKGVKF